MLLPILRNLLQPRRMTAMFTAGIAFASGANRGALAQTLPAELIKANSLVETAVSFRLIEVMGAKSIQVSFIRPDREFVDLQPQKIIRVGNNVWAQVPPVGAWKLVGNAGPGKLANFVNIGLPVSPVVRREADASDGTSAAHVYAVDYPGIHTTLHWYIRIADGKLHKIVGPSDRPGVEQVIKIDRYDAVEPINPPTIP
jgi:hypothetical protein